MHFSLTTSGFAKYKYNNKQQFYDLAFMQFK